MTTTGDAEYVLSIVVVNELAGKILKRVETTVSAGFVKVSACGTSVTVMKEVLVEAGCTTVVVLAGRTETTKAVVVCPGS